MIKWANVTMLRSLLAKLAMLAATVAVVFWIGWSVPPSIGEGQRDKVQPAQEPANEASATVGPSAAAGRPVPQGLAANRKIGAKESAPSSGQSASRLDLNRATAEDLQGLPGIGPVLAKRVLDHRKSLGSFRSVEELMQVKGIGRKKLASLRAHVRVQERKPVAHEKGRL